MLATLSLILSLASLAVASGLLVLLQRTRRARQSMAQEHHDKALALDLRCDELQRQIDALTGRGAIGQLQELVAVSERQGRLEAGRARRLERYVLDLHDEARRTAEAE